MNKTLSIIIVSGLLLAGITCIVLGVFFPEAEWVKHIAFFIFGSSTSPIVDLIRHGKIDKNSIVKGSGIGIVLAGVLSFTACGSIPLSHPETTMNIIQEDGKTCVEVKTKVCMEETFIEDGESCPAKN